MREYRIQLFRTHSYKLITQGRGYVILRTDDARKIWNPKRCMMFEGF